MIDKKMKKTKIQEKTIPTFEDVEGPDAIGCGEDKNHQDKDIKMKNHNK